MAQPLLLVVEDETLVLIIAQEALEAGGYTVLVATNGAEALQALDSRGDGLEGLITDVRLGDGPDGWHVARHARNLRPGLPIIYMTGDSAGDWATHGVPDSFVVQKPYAPAQLVTAISQLITRANTGPKG